MFELRPVSLKDKREVDKYVFEQNSRSADFNFGNLYMWDETYRQLICTSESRMITLLCYGEQPAFAFPVGEGDLRSVILSLKEYADRNGFPLLLYGVEEESKAELEALFPGQFAFSPHESSFDYIYRAEKLATYSGKTMHGKKNHCNIFESEHPDWTFVPLTKDMIPSCRDMLVSWKEANADRLDAGVDEEYHALEIAFSSYEELGLTGGVLLDEGKVIGFSIGELCAEDCFDVHFEKADRNIRGAYAMVCRELTRMAMARYPAVRYINREDDLGLDSLRSSKLSYKPEYLLKKYSARWISD